MLISHKKKFIFIHVYKIAGTSIRAALKPYNHRRTMVNRIKSRLNLAPRIFSNDFHPHVRMESLMERLPANIFQTYFKFGFVRNPWDWHVSLYHYMQQTPHHYWHDEVKKWTFDEYLNQRWEKPGYLQHEFLTDKDGNVKVDFIGRYENLETDFRKICSLLDLPDINLPVKRKSVHRDYRTYYTPETVDIISKHHRKDIELFDYSFE
jgi:hypothetical protein